MPRFQHIDLTVVDGASLYDAAAFITESAARSKVTIDYAMLRQRLDTLRQDNGWRAASLNTIILSIDPNSEGQQRFQTMLQHSGFEVDAIRYRNTFASVPPGRSHSEISGTGRPIVSLAAHIAYIAGLTARNKDQGPQLLVVSHAFELYGPLIDLKARFEERGGGKVGLAYFGRLLDYRWKASGLLDGKLGIEFFDLDQYSDDLLGIDLGSPASSTSEVKTGLSKF